MPVNALLVIDKPAGWTSHDVVARVRRLLGEKSVGHLGTLDPMATGVLPLVLGRLTRIAQFYGDSVKAYEGEIRFGFATNTYDAEGEPMAWEGHGTAREEHDTVQEGHDTDRKGYDLSPADTSAASREGHDTAREGHDFNRAENAVVREGHDFCHAESSAASREGHDFSRANNDTAVKGALAPAALTLDIIRAAARRFTGKLLQTPPPFSAKKINGVPAYKLARKDKDVELTPVEVEISEFEILSFDDGRATFRTVVSSGTYIRCIAHELGLVLGTGAHLSRLRRTRVAEFTEADAHTLEELESAADPGQLCIHPRRVLASMPAVTATEEQTNWIRNGRAVNLPELSRAKLIRVYSGQRDLIAIMSRIAGTLFHPKVVLIGGN